jgi:hypothetical protein
MRVREALRSFSQPQGRRLPLLRAKLRQGLAVLEHEALDGDGVRLVPLHDALNCGVGPDGVLEGGVAQVGDVARVGADRFGQPLHVAG